MSKLNTKRVKTVETVEHIKLAGPSTKATPTRLPPAALAGLAVDSEEKRVDMLADRRAKILERAGVRARREVALVPREPEASEQRFYDPDDYGATASGENVESDVGWLPLDGRPR
ncbi:MAG: hypothetical protein NT062_33460 [Proteobacteria bacterium]|nr:hypothetical protein [Pseudomonadota bacterium]